MRGARHFALGAIATSVLAGGSAIGTTAGAAADRVTALPLALVATYELPRVPTGPYADHMAIDAAGERLFVTPQAAHAVAVLDLRTGRVRRWLEGIADPHAILYRADRHRLFVTDGAGALLVFDADSYRRLQRIALTPGADGIAYDERSGLLYVANGGEDAGAAESHITLIDTAREARVEDIVLRTPVLEALAIDAARDRLYVNAPADNAILVIDLIQRRMIDRWPMSLARRNEAFALDAARSRLYVGCNEGDVRGALVVVDTNSGHELERLPLGSWVDSMFYDARRGRIYASTGIGEVFSYQQEGDGRLIPLTPTDTAVMARTSLYDPTLDRLYVMVPHLGWTVAKVLVFQPR
jgi:DNA-binding beta-propeller fold protein YncE